MSSCETCRGSRVFRLMGTSELHVCPFCPPASATLDPVALPHTDLADDERRGYRPALPRMSAEAFLLQSLDVFGPMKVAKVLANFHYHGYPVDVAQFALMHAHLSRVVRVGPVSEYVWLPSQRHPWCTQGLGFARRCWRRATGPKWLLLAITVVFLCCVALTWAPRAKAQDVPDSIIRGLVMVESGATWRDIGDIKGGWSKGAAGEISHFQLTREALREMKVEAKADRIRRCPVLAESYARKFLLICYEKRGNWRDALATYHRWSGYRSTGAQDYAERVLNLAAVL